MKKLLYVLLILAAALSLLTACGSKVEPQPAETAAPVAEEPAPADEAAEVPADEAVSGDVMDYVGKQVDPLKAAFGEPESSSYTSSCLGDGKDGMLCYPDFDVYTYLDESGEVIMDVELSA